MGNGQEGVENALSQKASVGEQCKYTGQMQGKANVSQTDSLVDTEEQNNRGGVKHNG